MADKQSGAATDMAERWIIGPPDRPISVLGATPLLAYLPLFLHGWPLRHASAGTVTDPSTGKGRDKGAAEIEIRRDGAEAFTITAPGTGAADGRFADAMSAANGLAGALVAALVTSDPDVICLHGASAAIGGRLVLLLGQSEAGKSSMAVQLAARGHRLFSDDRLALGIGAGDPGRSDAGHGICLGIAPKVRLPIPADMGPRFTALVREFTEIEAGEIAYLKLSPPIAAMLGESLPLGGVIVLDRRADQATPTLTPLAPAMVVRALIDHTFAPHVPAARLVAALGAMAKSLTGLRLSYANSAEAAILIGESLGPKSTDGAAQAETGARANG